MENKVKRTHAEKIGEGKVPLLHDNVTETLAKEKMEKIGPSVEVLAMYSLCLQGECWGAVLPVPAARMLGVLYSLCLQGGCMLFLGIKRVTLKAPVSLYTTDFSIL